MFMKKTILIIEDEARTRENLAVILDMEGYRVLSAENGRRGLELARSERPDLILCDVSMPELDGHDVLRAMRENSATASIPFIFLTARGERRDLRAGMDLGADDYLVKPAAATELLACLEARFKRASQQTTSPAFQPDFSSPAPLKQLGLTDREAEVLLWVAQGKSNSDIGRILGAAENTIKRHLQHIFEKLGLDNRHAAIVRALEILAAS